MIRLFAGCLLIAVGILAQPQLAAAQDGVAHMVFFKLKDASADSKEKLVQACRKYLSEHPGTVHFSAGVRAEDMQRDVNDQAFDVALHVVFANQEAHDKYQVHERHLKFIEENKDNWDNVRVFDSRVPVPAVRERVRRGDQNAGAGTHDVSASRRSVCRDHSGQGRPPGRWPDRRADREDRKAMAAQQSNRCPVPGGNARVGSTTS